MTTYFKFNWINKETQLLLVCIRGWLEILLCMTVQENEYIFHLNLHCNEPVTVVSCVSADWHMTVSECTYSTHPQPCLENFPFKYLRRDIKAGLGSLLLSAVGPIRRGTPPAELSQERTNREEEEEETERQANVQSRGPADAMTRFTEVSKCELQGPGQAWGFHSSCKNLQLACARHCDSWKWGKSMREKKTPCKWGRLTSGCQSVTGHQRGEKQRSERCFMEPSGPGVISAVYTLTNYINCAPQVNTLLCILNISRDN